MPIEIKYNLKLEKQRIKKTIDKFVWYEKFGYRPRFPQNINPKGEKNARIVDPLFKKYFKPPINSFFKKFAGLHSKI